MKTFKKIPQLLFLLLMSVSSWAQLYVRTDNFTIRDGLSDNRVRSLMKDPTGFIWVGTLNGLNRYDGHSFRVFRPSQANSLSNEVINDIVADDSGYIWVATMDGLNRYDPRRDRWVNILPVDDDFAVPGIPSNLIWDLYLDQEQRLWIVCDVRELTCLDLRTGKYTRYDWPEFARNHSVINTTSYRSVQQIVPGRTGFLWLATNRGLVEFDMLKGTFRFVGGGYNASVRDIQYNPEGGEVVLVTEEGSVYRYEEATGVFSPGQVRVLPYPSKNWMQPSAGDRWLASPHGLIQWRTADNSLWLHVHIPQIEGFLQPGGVNRVYAESPEVQWVASPNGLNRMNWGDDMARFIPLTPVSFREGHNIMTSVYFNADANQYFVCSGTERKVYIIDEQEGVSVYDNDLQGRPFAGCNAVLPDNRGRLWLLTENAIYQYDRRRRGFQRAPMPPAGIPYNFRDMVQAPDGSLWLAAFVSGIWRFHPESGKWDSLNIEGSGLVKKPTSLCYDSAARRIWIGTFSTGLFSWSGTEGLQRRRPSGEGRSVASVPGLVHDVVCDNEGNVIVATDAGGIFRIRIDEAGKEQWHHFTMRSGLLSNHFLSVAPGDNGEIWALSGHRVHHLDSMGRNILPLLANRVIQVSTHASDKRMPHSVFFDAVHKQLLFASGGGLSMVPGKIKAPAHSIPLVITEVNMGEGWKHLFDTDSDHDLELPYKYNSIAFTYAALQYQPGVAISYQHRLEGYDRFWVDAGNLFLAHYPNLSPGPYRFAIRAVAPDGRVLQQSSYFSFTVVPPFWRTWWFILGVALLIGMGLYWWIQTLRSNVRSQKILTYFATSLYGQNTVDDVFWDVARNCIGELKFVDCVIYQYDEEREMLVQRAAYGPKSPNLHELLNPLELPIGKGIVGHVALSRKAEIVKNTSRDARYVVDDNRRNSEMAVPIIVDGKLFGVIDSEHPKKGFYTRRHLKLMTRIAEICAAKISKYQIEEKLRLKIARDLHDELGSTLTSINIISKMALGQVSQTLPLADQLHKIKDHSARMMDSMSDIVWAINPANDSFEKTIVRIKEFTAEILEPAGITFYFEEDERLGALQLDIEKRKELYMFYKEAITNAAKYSQASEVNITFKKIDTNLQLTIVDNGNGFDVKNQYQGNGIRNMRNRAAQIKAEFRIDSIPGTGTSIHLNIPIT